MRTSTCTGTGWALVGRVPGTIAGALLLAALPERGLAILLAAVVLLGRRAHQLPAGCPPPRRRNVVLAGATSGLLGTATSIGGPPMALVWQRNSGARLRGTMSGFFLIGSVMSLVALAFTGAVDGHTLRTFAVLMPAAVAGFALSRYVNRFLDPARLRLLAIAVSAIGAVGAHCPGGVVTQGEAMGNDVSVRKVKSAVRTVELLEFLADRHDRPARIREICAALDMPRSSAHALLRTLVEAGWVRSDASGTLYGIGIRALLVGTSYLDSDPYLPLITPFLDELRADLDETFHLGRLDGTDVVYLATRESKQYVRVAQPGGPTAAGLRHRAGQGAAGRPVRHRPGRARSVTCSSR